MPEEFVPRPAEFTHLLGHLLDANWQKTVAITTALEGAGGFGKTMLAIALCHCDDVITAFDDGILMGYARRKAGLAVATHQALRRPDR